MTVGSIGSLVDWWTNGLIRLFNWLSGRLLDCSTGGSIGRLVDLWFDWLTGDCWFDWKSCRLVD